VRRLKGGGLQALAACILCFGSRTAAALALDSFSRQCACPGNHGLHQTLHSLHRLPRSAQVQGTEGPLLPPLGGGTGITPLYQASGAALCCVVISAHSLQGSSCPCSCSWHPVLPMSRRTSPLLLRLSQQHA